MILNSNIVLKILNILAWVGFLGLCVKAGSIIYSFCVSIFHNPIAATNLYWGLDLSQLKEYNNSEYTILVLCVIGIIILQTVMFFLLLQIFKNINLVSPFHEKIGKLILRLSLLAFGIGLLSKLTLRFSTQYTDQGMNFPHLIEHIGLGDAFVLFGGILFFISVLFKKGIELQNESDLTI
jgi:hypothetical protein